MSDKEISALIAIKHELKTTRAKVRELVGQNERWKNIAQSLRKIAGLDDGQFRNLLKAESLPSE
jgi:hypothetical protein